MISSILLCGAIVLGVQAPEGVRAIGGAKRVRGGRGRGRQGRHRPGPAALWCEAHGLTAERLEHLSRAVRLQPTNVLAPGLLGLVRYQGQWERPDDVGERVRNDPDRQALVREYLQRRAATPDTPQAQLKLAAWCADNGLKEQATAHYNAVIRLDPSVRRGVEAPRLQEAGISLGPVRRGRGSEAGSHPPEAGRQALANEAGEAAQRLAQQGCREAGAGRASAGRGDRPARSPAIWACS